MTLSVIEAADEARAHLCAGARHIALSPAQQAALVRFPRRRRKAVRQLALAHPYLADLMVSFPAAIFAIAHGRRRRTVDARCLAIAGASLRDIALALEIPFWLRRMPPEACGPALLLPLPDSADFSARVANLTPRSAADWGGWLEAVSLGSRIMDEAFALWLAREFNRHIVPGGAQGLAAIALWAWYGTAERNAASSMIVRGWEPRMSLTQAARDTLTWLHALDYLLFEAPEADGIAPPGDNHVGDFTFVELEWGLPLVAEGMRMRNCLGTYAAYYSRGSRIWSIRRDGVPVADMEISLSRTRRGVPRLEQLHAVGNSDASDAVWAAAYQWLSRWRLLAEERPVAGGEPRLRRGAWLELWLPFWRAKGSGLGLPMPVTSDYEQSVEHMIDAVRPLGWATRRRSG